MRDAFKNAIRSNMQTMVLMFPFIVYLFAGLFLNNNALRRQIAEDETRNREQHASSLANRKEIEDLVRKNSKRLEEIEATLAGKRAGAGGR